MHQEEKWPVSEAPGTFASLAGNSVCADGDAYAVGVASAQASVCFGRNIRARTTTRSANAPAKGVSGLPAAASPAVAAHPMDENASAKVAMRDEVWRRRK